MRRHILTAILLVIFAITLTTTARATPAPAPDQRSLVYIRLASPDDLTRFAGTGLPSYAMLEGGLLTGAGADELRSVQEAGLSYQVLSQLNAGPFYLATTHSSRRAPDFSSYGQVLLITSNGVLLRPDPGQVNRLSQAGVELQAISLTPKPLPSAGKQHGSPAVVDPDPIIQGIIDQVNETQVYTYDRQLAGELPVWVDGSDYTIGSRYTYSGEPIEKTMHYVYQHMQDLGLGVEYQEWGGPTYPNVIGQITGLINPQDIYIIGGHIDDVAGAPGADDNASGSVAALMAADIFSQYRWGCTLRFAFWTGEEQGLNGSEAYAQRAYNNGENILGYLNLDMIAWNTPGSDPYINLIYTESLPPTLDLANLYADVLTAYKLDLLPRLGTGITGSDHSSFWQYGFTSILAIEDDLGGDFNPYYHSPQDTPAHTDPTYFTNFVKASLATYAHMSGCLIPSGIGHLDGHVTAATGGAPLQGAKVEAQDTRGHAFPATTDASGYYTRTLLADTFTVTASAYGYLPASIGGVIILTDTVTTRDFALDTAPTHIVSGTVTETGTGVPLQAEISFSDSPVIVWSDPTTGYYQAELPENSYSMEVRAAVHRPQQRTILLDHDQIQNFALDPLPCILLVDDDANGPDVNGYYTAVLDGLGADYDLWDTAVSGDPSLNDISGYRKLLWYTGFAYNNTFNDSNATAVSAYLDNGGNFFLSGQDYLYDVGLTPFGQNYLHINNYTNDVSQSSVAGRNVFNMLGIYYLDYLFTNYSDVVNPDAQAQVAFLGNKGNAAISYDGAGFKTVFFGFPFEAIPQIADREAVMERMLGFFGACSPPDGWLDGHVTDAVTGSPLEGVLVTATPGMAGVNTLTDPNGYYTMTLPAGSYLVEASLPGYAPQTQVAVITAGQTTTLDFALQTLCEPISGLDFSWLPLEPYKGQPVTFTAVSNGTPPTDYQWTFGDGSSGAGNPVTHTFAAAGSYTIDLLAKNACSLVPASKEIFVNLVWKTLLPLLVKN